MFEFINPWAGKGFPVGTSAKMEGELRGHTGQRLIDFITGARAIGASRGFGMGRRNRNSRIQR